jgi:uncharacterized protein YecT (DUF1311 family)
MPKPYLKSVRRRREEFLFLSAAWAVSLLLPAGVAYTADPGVSPTPDPVEQKVQALIDKAGGSTSAMAAATYEGARLWDEELNRVYPELMRQLPPQDQAILKESEKEWIKFRDSNRRLIEETYGKASGLDNRLFAAAEVLDIIKSRAVALRGYLQVVEESAPN